MTITNGYCSLAEVKERLDIPTADTASDAMVEQIVTAVSRWIDDFTGRRFYLAQETRYYTADADDELWIDDITAVTTLKTDNDGDRTYETTWAVTDYDLLPNNAVLEGKPYSKIVLAPAGSNAFPASVKKGIQLIGSFGYSSTTSSGRCTIIKEACLLQAERIYKRKDTPLGIAGAPNLGEQRVNIPGLDPDVKSMLEPFMRLS